MRSHTLPPFCMVDPSFTGESQGGSSDDHPHADIRSGEVLLGQIYNALSSGPNWSRTSMIVVYDEWGGFLEHAIPPVRPISNDELALDFSGGAHRRAGDCGCTRAVRRCVCGDHGTGAIELRVGRGPRAGGAGAVRSLRGFAGESRCIGVSTACRLSALCGAYRDESTVNRNTEIALPPASRRLLCGYLSELPLKRR